MGTGGYGVTNGHDVWGAIDPGEVVGALRAVVHEAKRPETAVQLLH